MGFGTAFKDGELQHVSASQITSFEACSYKWYGEKILKRPSFQDFSWARLGVAIHKVLEQQVNAAMGKESEEESRIISFELMEEAEKFVGEYFDWEKYFLGHELMEAEMEMVYPLELTDFVGSADVVSINEDGIICITDWKTGYAADKGVDIQAQAYALMGMRNFSVENIIFRRIYPRLPGEERGTRKIEEYYFDLKDAKRYEQRINHLVSKMIRISKGELDTHCSPSDHCVYCGFAHDCPLTKDEAFTPKELVNKLKALKAGAKQVEEALKKVADIEGSFIVGDEEWGFQVGESYRLPRDIKSSQIPELLAAHNPQLLKDKAIIRVDGEIKEFLEGLGFENIKNIARKTFKWLNEKELKEAAKEEKKAQGTSGASSKAAS